MPGTTEAARRQMRVIWQAPSREFREVGCLSLPEDARGDFEFSYIDPLPAVFRPFLAFPERDRIYRSRELFPFFRSRVMSVRRPEYRDHLEALGLSPEDATPFEILSRTSGERATDTVQVVPHAEEHSDGRVTQLFLASGVRHLPEAPNAITRLEPGDRLVLVDEPGNDWDPRAVLLSTRSDERVGYVPSYLLSLVHKLREDRSVVVEVVRANGPETPWHLRLLCRLDAGGPAELQGNQRRRLVSDQP